MKWIIVVIISGLTSGVNAETHVGVGRVGLWDFSEASLRMSIDDPWDFGVAQTLNGPTLDLFVAANYYMGAAVALMPPGLDFDEVTEAPEDESEYASWIPWADNRVWICRTVEGHFAKVCFHANMSQFDYVYQDDGTRDVTTPVPTAVTTWGHVKALYK